MDRREAPYGTVLEVMRVGEVTVTRRYSCIRRDQYEITAAGAFPDSVRERLARRGATTGGPALYVLDVPGAFQLTVAPRAGRALLMPRLATEPPSQRSAALDVAEAIDVALGRPAS